MAHTGSDLSFSYHPLDADFDLVFVHEGARASPSGEPNLHAERLQTLGRLMAMLAHDLRDPVVSILQTADYMSTKATELPWQIVTSQLRDITSSCRDLVRTIDSALTYTRRESSREVNVSLCEVIDRTGSFLRSLLRDGGHTLLWRLGPDAEWVRGDPVLLQQIFLNLLGNSLRLARAPCTVRCSTSRRRGGDPGAGGDPADPIVAHIVDDGPGVPPELRDRIFEPFFTTRPDGNGLGLAAAREAARALGGDIQLEPTEHGACFVLTLRSGDPPLGTPRGE